VPGAPALLLSGSYAVRPALAPSGVRPIRVSTNVCAPLVMNVMGALKKVRVRVRPGNGLCVRRLCVGMRFCRKPTGGSLLVCVVFDQRDDRGPGPFRAVVAGGRPYSIAQPVRQRPGPPGADRPQARAAAAAETGVPPGVSRELHSRPSGYSARRLRTGRGTTPAPTPRRQPCRRPRRHARRQCLANLHTRWVL
jgi:hypothetical protein